MDARYSGNVDKFIDILNTLTLNSKPIINQLTMLAEQNIGSCGVIMDLVFDRTFSANEELKIPALYLVDSILKNIGGPYVRIISSNIVNIFVHVFKMSNLRNRSALYKLRLTWNDFINPNVLNHLDHSVNELDRNWPILVPKRFEDKDNYQRSSTIHVNPRFLKNEQSYNRSHEYDKYSSMTPKRHYNDFSQNPPGNNDKYDSRSYDFEPPFKNSNLYNSVDHFYDDPNNRFKVEIDVNPSNSPSNTLKSNSPVNIIDTSLPKQSVMADTFNLTNLDTIKSATPDQLVKTAVSSLLNSVVKKQLDPSDNTNDSLDGKNDPVSKNVLEFIKKLIEKGSQTGVDFNVNRLRSRRCDSLINSLYNGIQCGNCGLRFSQDRCLYDSHLDWHFRNNKKDINSKRSVWRMWYFLVSEWLSMDEVTKPPMENEETQSADNTLNKNSQNIEQITCSIKPFVNEVCEVCLEPFERCFLEETEEWRYKSAKRFNDKPFHLACYKDFLLKVDKSVQSTNDALTNNDEELNIYDNSLFSKPINDNRRPITGPDKSDVAFD